ncbi:MAG: type II toxin-antitoxin system MqsA family antitoxin [Planctomycetes bacterium]|nr:type II toxin-antitoxin system MqsA family antitoxin [Planctomycetota bacterium]MBI3848194.1 type II toxin-antitoxin system MqsA family antitoxin [Planctomycetota bacterium]
MMHLTRCPTCGSRRIKLVRRDFKREFRGRAYTVPKLAFHECAACGEKVFDPAAVRRIQSYSPAFKRSRSST